MERRLKSLDWLNRNKIVLVSNRGAYVLRETAQGLKGERSTGGLVSALEPLAAVSEGVWIAWGGRSGGNSSGVRIGVPLGHPQYTLREIILTPEEVEGYYYAFANRVLWPFCHYFLEKCDYSREAWVSYRRANEKFAQITCEEAAAGDFIWVHDYHLSLVPRLIRNEDPHARIGFFWHIPFPDAGFFRTLPQAREILAGLLGSDFLGFHVPAYCRNFLDAVKQILGARVNQERGTAEWEGRRIAVQSLPVGVDYEAFSKMARKAEVRARARELRDLLGAEYVALGVDRLDYTKGIKERLLGLELFFEKNPAYRGRLTYVQIAVPTRAEVPEYQNLRHEVEEIVGRINGRFGRPGWAPVVYFYRALPRLELVACYLAADLLLVTPLRDGLNLVAKEYAATHAGNGVLILSHFAGAAEELTAALLVNPYDLEELSDQIQWGLEMPEAEKVQRMEALTSVVARRDVLWWVDSFLAAWRAGGAEPAFRLFGSGQRSFVRPLLELGEEERSKEKKAALGTLWSSESQKGEGF